MWKILSLDSSGRHFDAAKMFIELNTVAHDVCQRVITNDMCTRDRTTGNIGLDAYVRFALFWRILDDLNPHEIVLEAGLPLMLDTVNAHQPKLQLLGRSWLRESVVANINRLVFIFINACPLLHSHIIDESIESLIHFSDACSMRNFSRMERIRVQWSPPTNPYSMRGLYFPLCFFPHIFFTCTYIKIH